MRLHHLHRWAPVLAALLAVTGGAAASGRQASFGVSVQVLPTRPAPQALATLPLPPQAQALTSHRFGASYHYAGSAEAAATFFNDSLAEQGYRLLQTRIDRGAQEQYWQRDAARLQVRIQPVLGATAAARIAVQASEVPALQ